VLERGLRENGYVVDVTRDGQQHPHLPFLLAQGDVSMTDGPQERQKETS
jgi:hypothetical protein